MQKLTKDQYQQLFPISNGTIRDIVIDTCREYDLEKQQNSNHHFLKSTFSTGCQKVLLFIIFVISFVYKVIYFAFKIGPYIIFYFIFGFLFFLGYNFKDHISNFIKRQY